MRKMNEVNKETSVFISTQGMVILAGSLIIMAFVIGLISGTRRMESKIPEKTLESEIVEEVLYGYEMQSLQIEKKTDGTTVLTYEYK